MGRAVRGSPPCVRADDALDDPRVGREESVDVGVDLADIGAEGGGEGDRGRIRTATAEGRDVIVLDTPGSRRDRDLALLDRAGDALGDHADDLRDRGGVRADTAWAPV